MMTIRPYRFPLAAMLLLIAMVSCSVHSVNLPGVDVNDETEDDGIAVSDIVFLDDYRRIRVYLDEMRSIPGLPPEDSSEVKVKVTDSNCGKEIFNRCRELEVESVGWAGTDQVDSLGISVLAMVDLTRPAKELQMTRDRLLRIYSTFGSDHMFIRFMYPGGDMSPVVQASRYIIENYVSGTSKLMKDVSDKDSVRPYVYRDVAAVYESLRSRTTGTALDSTRYSALLVFSGEGSFDDASNYPLDPDYYRIQETLLGYMDAVPDNLRVFFLEGDEDEDAGQNLNMMKVICARTGGLFVKGGDPAVLLRNIFRSFDLRVPDYVVTVRNVPDAIYYGSLRSLRVDFYNAGGTLVATASGRYKIGGISRDKLLGAGLVSSGQVFMKGLRFFVAVLLSAFVLMQFVIPYVRYRIFRRKHIVRYTSPRQMVNSMILPETCYLCKAPFVPGDKVVAKCRHVMHLECWNENDYHCPEYGPACPGGSHFYDSAHPFNSRNAPFYIRWIMASIPVAFVCWMLIVIPDGSGIVNAIGALVNHLVSVSSSVSDLSVDVLSVNHYFLPVLAVRNVFLITLALSFMTIHRRRRIMMFLDALVRSLAASAVSLLIFAFLNYTVILSQSYESSIFTMWIPWSVSVLAVEYCLTFHTNIRLRHRRYLYAALIVGIGSSFLFGYFGSFDSARQIVSIFPCHLFLSTGIAAAVAGQLPGCRKSFLRMTGSVKEMDIALYKWFRADPGAVVTVGKSVDCSVRIYWESGEDIAPVHAAIRMVNGIHTLCVMDSPVQLNNKELRYGSRHRLYYGDVIRIGSTRLTYLGI